VQKKRKELVRYVKKTNPQGKSKPGMGKKETIGKEKKRSKTNNPKRRGAFVFSPEIGVAQKEISLSGNDMASTGPARGKNRKKKERRVFFLGNRHPKKGGNNIGAKEERGIIGISKKDGEGPISSREKRTRVGMPRPVNKEKKIVPG